jgi:uncharacterized protein YukE
MSPNVNDIPVSGAIDGARIAVPTMLELAGRHINDQAAVIVGELEALKSLLLPLQETWTGQAAADYELLQQEWNLGAQGLFGGNGAPGVLGEIAMAMHIVWNNYSDAEFSNVQMWRPGH